MTLESVKILERRGKPRVETKVKIRVGDVHETFTGNLSKCGVFLETNRPFAAVGERVQMDITLPASADSIRVTGKVTRVIGPHRVGNVPGIGIEFLRVEARQVRTFERLIDHLLEARGIGSRKYPRVKTQLVVELRTRSQARQAISENLSKGGLFLKTPVDGLVLGDMLSVVLVHPSSKRKFETDAKVVHLRKGDSAIREDFVEGVGVEFLLPASRKNELSGFLRSLLTVRR